MTARRASPPEPAAPAQKLPPYRLVGTHELTGFKNNPRVHSPDQVARIAASITEFGFTNPILIDGRKGIIAGHGRLLAAQKLGLAVVPTIELRGLSDAQKRALVIADNKLAEDAAWENRARARRAAGRWRRPGWQRQRCRIAGRAIRHPAVLRAECARGLVAGSQAGMAGAGDEVG